MSVLFLAGHPGPGTVSCTSWSLTQRILVGWMSTIITILMFSCGLWKISSYSMDIDGTVDTPPLTIPIFPKN